MEQVTGQLTPGSKCSEQEPWPLSEALTRGCIGCPFDVLHGASTSLTPALRTTYPHLALLSPSPSGLEAPGGHGPRLPEILKAVELLENHSKRGRHCGPPLSPSPHANSSCGATWLGPGELLGAEAEARSSLFLPGRWTDTLIKCPSWNTVQGTQKFNLKPRSGGTVSWVVWIVL